VTDGGRPGEHTARMPDTRGRYWDLDRAEWVRYEAPKVEVPAQQTGVEEEEVADVRSG
jgi:hypothetical protein